MKIYRLKKSTHIFRHVLKLYRRKKNRLTILQRQEVCRILNELQENLLKKSREGAHQIAQNALEICQLYLKKSFFEKCRDFIIGLGLALCAAVLIRTMWFELMEIPTGSMRPTFAEQDRLTVSKTNFGINIPLKQGHFYFNPELVLRNGTFIFTGAGMDISDVDTVYFYLFPGKKQFVKRLIGKPGDMLYFYGGQIYGIDQEGNDITPLLNPIELSKIDHIPFIHFNGKTIVPNQPATGGIFSPIIIKQMNEPLAKLSLSSTNKIKGELLPPYAGTVEDYYQLWGFEDYGIARLLTKDQMLHLAHTGPISEAPLYMEIFHHPTIKFPKIERDHFGRPILSIGTTTSILPLTEGHLKTLMANLYTARFTVKNGKAFRYGSKAPASICPDLKDIPDGTYEFYYGKGYQVHLSGVRTALPKQHPLYHFSVERIQLLYNLGIEFNTFFAPHVKEQYLLPSRYVYYRNGDLYALGAPLMRQGDSILSAFIEKERLRQQNASTYQPYFPFIDPGPPMKADGRLNTSLIKERGLKIPSKHYLALGDNYAMSADSRDFGFVPEENIRGAPDFVFWPPGQRFGFPLQAPYPFFNKPRTIVWILALIGFGSYYIIHRKRYGLSQKIDPML